MANFYFEEDMGPLLPYINAVAERAELYDRPPMVRFVFQGIYCAVYPRRCIASPMESQEHVRGFVDELVTYLTSILERKDEIVPRNTVFKPGAVPQILQLLPKTNCGDCGLKTCMAFAAMVAKQQVSPSQCPYMTRPLAQTYPVLDQNGCEVSQVTLHLDGRETLPAPGQELELPVETDDSPDIPGKESIMSGIGIEESDRDLTARLLPEPLTPRELEVLALMGEGRTNPEISKELTISPHTVKSHVIHIFNKLGVNDRTQAAVWAARNKII